MPSVADLRAIWRRVDLALRISAALVATLPVSLLGSAAFAAVLPVPGSAAVAVGILAFIPIWLAAMCVCFLARRGWLAWIVCIAATAALAALVPDAAFWPDWPD